MVRDVPVMCKNLAYYVTLFYIKVRGIDLRLTNHVLLTFIRDSTEPVRTFRKASDRPLQLESLTLRNRKGARLH